MLFGLGEATPFLQWTGEAKGLAWEAVCEADLADGRHADRRVLAASKYSGQVYSAICESIAHLCLASDDSKCYPQACLAGEHNVISAKESEEFLFGRLEFESLDDVVIVFPDISLRGKSIKAIESVLPLFGNSGGMFEVFEVGFEDFRLISNFLQGSRELRGEVSLWAQKGNQGS